VHTFEVVNMYILAHTAKFYQLKYEYSSYFIVSITVVLKLKVLEIL